VSTARPPSPAARSGRHSGTLRSCCATACPIGCASGSGAWADRSPGSTTARLGWTSAPTTTSLLPNAGCAPNTGQIISELGFGFWRFLLARRYQTTLWPDLAAGFPRAPSRRRQLVEDPVVRLHEFRNRLAHHQRIWSEPAADRLEDCLTLAGYVDDRVRDWIATTSRVPNILADNPRRPPAG